MQLIEKAVCENGASGAYFPIAPAMMIPTKPIRITAGLYRSGVLMWVFSERRIFFQLTPKASYTCPWARLRLWVECGMIMAD